MSCNGLSRHIAMQLLMLLRVESAHGTPHWVLVMCCFVFQFSVLRLVTFVMKVKLVILSTVLQLINKDIAAINKLIDSRPTMTMESFTRACLSVH